MGRPLRKNVAVALTLFMLLVFSTTDSLTLGKAEREDADYVIQTTVTFSNKGTNAWNLTDEDREISLFMNNTWQTVYLTESSPPIDRRKLDEDGNPIALLQLPNSTLGLGENVTYTVTYNVESKSRSIPQLNEEESGNLTEISEDLKGEYCGEGDAWQIYDPMLQGTAYTIAGDDTNVLSVVKKIVAWIWNNIRYPAHRHEIPWYPNQTLLYRKGDCDDQAILLITLCRICGIPSYLQVGCIYGSEFMMNQSSWNGTVTSVLKRIAWHGWAVVYVPPWGWLPVDLTYVGDGRDDPLNALRTGAVTMRETIQYMNISQRDYIASSRRYRDLLIENQIYIYQEDEMSLTSQNSLEDPKIWISWFLIAIIITSALLAVSAYILRAERRRFKPLNRPHEKACVSQSLARKSLFARPFLQMIFVCRKRLEK